LADGPSKEVAGELRVSGEYIVVGLIALGLLGYLSYVLFRPEKF
jgi:K+-transporting ATPase KdpF subunit